MKYLFDTCVLSEIHRPHGSKEVRKFCESIPDIAMRISAISIGEIMKGIGKLQPGKKRTELLEWLDETEQEFSSRILVVGPAVARTWGQILAVKSQGGVVIPVIDGLIAATALHHDLTVATRNTRHFAAAGCKVVNPWNKR